jgi:hypothetical protein
MGLGDRHGRLSRDADLQALVDSGRGVVPLVQLRWRCQQCGSNLIDVVACGYRPASGPCIRRRASRPSLQRLVIARGPLPALRRFTGSAGVERDAGCLVLNDNIRRVNT